MTDWASFFDMGGYAGYVWPAYGISIFAICALTIISWRWMRKAERLAAVNSQTLTKS